jgi:hypothetical protein
VHPLLAQRGRLGPYLFAWVPLGGIVAGLLVLAGGVSPTEAVALAVPMVLVYAFLCLSSWWICRVTPLRHDALPRIAATFFTASLVAGSLWVLWCGTLAYLLGLVPGLEGLPDRLSRGAPVVFLLGVLLYLLVVAIHYALLAADEAARLERRELELLSQAREAELSALKEQLNPHFLFNALNSISALTTSSPQKAREMCVLLADFLRRTLGLSERRSIPLSEEVDLAHGYLAVEKVRFGERLHVLAEIEEGASIVEVPPLLLQPLVENAVKHGISALVEGGTVHLSAHRAAGRLEIAVESSASSEPSEPAGRRGAGMGLKNVRKRLATRYGGDATLRERPTSGLFRVEISLPLEPAEA